MARFITIILYLQKNNNTMYIRNIIKNLLIWKDSDARKPLIVRGARQVGKTSIIHQFGEMFPHYIYLNLEREKDANLFLNYSSINELVENLLFLNKVNLTHKNKTLIFIDEIQEVPKAINTLRYFYEEFPEIYVIAAGSLLETILSENISIPVGRVEFRLLRPVCFEEFLGAVDEKNALDEIQKIPIADFTHTKLMDLFRDFIFIGGMPEIVKNYAKNKNLHLLQPIYESLLVTYQNDFEKYAKNNSQAQILRHILTTMGSEFTNRIKFQNFGNSNYKSREAGEALKTLEKAMLINLVYPITNTTFPLISDFKKSPRLHFLDTGLLNKMAGIQKEILLAKTLDNVYFGKVVEHYVGQEILASNYSPMHQIRFWTKENKDSNAEVDYVIPYESLLIPVEVKSGAVGRLRSLHEFMDVAPHQIAVRIFSEKYKVENVKTIKGKPFKLINLPFYLSHKINEYIALNI